MSKQKSHNHTGVNVRELMAKIRKVAKPAFIKGFGMPAIGPAPGGEPGEIVFAINATNAVKINFKHWNKIKQNIISSFRNSGLQVTVREMIWTNKGDVRAKPRVIITVKLLKNLELIEDWWTDFENKITANGESLARFDKQTKISYQELKNKALQVMDRTIKQAQKLK